MPNNKFPVSPEELDQAFKQPVVNEAKQVKDAVGQALELGQQTTQNTQDPQAQAQKQQQEAQQKQKDEKAKKYWREYLIKYQQDEARLKQQHQLKAQKKQQGAQEEQKQVQIKQFEKKKKQESFEVQHIKGLQAKAEIKKGVGG